MIYAISDVHAHTELFERFKATLAEDDQVYVLGDAIDKGDGTLDVLQTIIDDNRFTMLLGNHEHMMYQYLMDPDDLQLFGDWCLYNDGFRTLENYISLTPERQEKILNALENMPVQVELDIEKRIFVMAHACCDNNGTQTVKDSSTEFKVWHRQIPCEIENKYTLTGHTPVMFVSLFSDLENSSEIIRYNNWFGIDCGLAVNDGNGKLGVVNLTDLSVKHIKERK